jgi:3-deoxy-manno-octulosonate cytidylyltransferase (CMP-KDO synthetase)
MTTLAVLPSRYLASRFPGKPLVFIAGKPMIQWVWEATIAAKGVDQVVVATDDARIASVVTNFGGLVVMTDPLIPSGTDRVAAAVASMDCHFDVILNIQGDEPAMHPETISSVVDLMLQNKDIQIGTASCPFNSVSELFDPNAVKVVTNDSNQALYFSRSPIPYLRNGQTAFKSDFSSWLLPGQLACFHRHLGIYAYRPEALCKFTSLDPHWLEQFEMLEQLRALAAGMIIGVARTPHLSLGVDTPDDIRAVESILIQRRFKNN